MKANLPKFAFVLFLVLFGVLASNAQDSDKSDKSANKPEKTDVNKDKSKDCPKTGVVKLRVTFDKSGKVTKAEIISSGGCNYFDEEALEAAKKIKFEPAKKNGKKITAVKIVAYNFTAYD